MYICKITIIISMFTLIVGCTSLPEQSKYTEKLRLSSSARSVIELPEGQPDLDATLLRMSYLDEPQQQGVVIALLNISDTSCEEYMASSVTTANGIKSVLDVGSVLFSAAGTLALGGQTNEILAALSTFSNGTSDTLADNILGGNRTSLLYKSVMAQRAEDRFRILALMYGPQGQPMLAAAELGAYHAKCGVTVGINGLEDAVEQINSSAEENGTQQAMQLLKSLPTNNLTTEQSSAETPQGQPQPDAQ